MDHFLAFLSSNFCPLKNVKVARFARNVECDFFCDFQTFYSDLKTYFTTFFFIEIDASSNFLWVVDSGNSGIFTQPRFKCQAKLVQIHLTKAPVLKIVHEFPREIISKKSIIMDMVILGSPNREFFMSDIVQGCIIKYSQQEKKAVKIQSLEYMKPINTPIKINGHFLYLHFGVTGLSLVNVSPHW